MAPVAVLAVTETISWGVLYYSFAVVLLPMQTELGWDPAAISMAFSLGLLVAGVAAPTVGRWVDVHGPRRVMSTGSALAAAAMLAWSQVQSMAAMYAVWIVIGIAMAGTLYEPAVATLGRYPVRQRHTALLAITGVAGFASTIFTPLTERLVSTHGWRTTLVLLGAILATTFPLHFVALPGSSRRQRPSAERPSENRLTSAPRPVHIRAEATAFGITHAVATAVSAHVVAFLVMQGYSPAAAASLAGAIGVAKVAGRVAVTVLLRYHRAAAVSVTVFALEGVALLVPVLARTISSAFVLVIVFGAASGALTILRPALISERFGDHSFGHLNGRVARTSTLAGAAAPAAVGLGVSVTGSYTLGWLTLGLLTVGAAALLTGAHPHVGARRNQT